MISPYSLNFLSCYALRAFYFFTFWFWIAALDSDIAAFSAPLELEISALFSSYVSDEEVSSTSFDVVYCSDEDDAWLSVSDVELEESLDDELEVSLDVVLDMSVDVELAVSFDVEFYVTSCYVIPSSEVVIFFSVFSGYTVN